MSPQPPTVIRELFVQVTGCFRPRSTTTTNHRQTGADFPWYVVPGQ